MARTDSNLPAPRLRWYHGLSRYQWWVLIVASMGWMFDTMDQQFFNLGRQPAMREVLKYDPVDAGIEKLGKEPPAQYSAAALDGLVESRLLTPDQVKTLLTRDGKPIESAARKDVAAAIGEALLRPRFAGLGEAKLNEKEVAASAFDRAAVADLVKQGILSQEVADKRLAFTSPTTQAGEAPAPEPVVTRDEVAYELGKELAKAEVSQAGDNATLIFVMGWAVGGLFFGWVGDSLGRAKTMALTILTYALFTGLNGLARTEMEFNILRFLTALGVGGEFAAGAALVAETMPDRSRPAALGTLQALSAIGNMTAAALAFFIMPVLGWRWLFAIGALPGIVAMFVFLGLHEPEKWKAARAKVIESKASGKRILSSYGALFAESKWRNRAIVAMLLGVVGVGGLWGIGFFTPELMRSICTGRTEAQREKIVAVTFFLQQCGAFFGISAYTVLSLRMGRRPAFAVFFVAAFAVLSYTFLFVDKEWEAYVMLPLVGFVTLGPFGGYAIYFPELFPTRLRATGTGFGYNIGRFLAALVPGIKSSLKGMFMAGTISLPMLASAAGDAQRAVRYGSFLMLFIYLAGLVVLLFAPETKDQPLPED